MSIDISHETEARITDEARKQGISVEALLEQLMSERVAMTAGTFGDGAKPKLPVLHLGDMGPLHRRDIYADVRRAGSTRC